MNTKVLAVAVVAVLVVGGLAAVFVLTDNDDDNNEKLSTAGKEITDAAGRKVIVPDNLNNGIITVGSNGPLRFLSCFDVVGKVIEVDKGDVTDPKNGRAYSYAYDYTNLEWHPDNVLEAETAEKIGNKNPSLIVTSLGIWNSYKATFEPLSEHFTTLVIPNQDMMVMWTSDYKAAPWLQDMFNMIGTMLGQEDRAKEMIDGVNGIFADVRTYVKTPVDVNTYVAGLTINGSNPLNTTFPTYLPLMLVSGKNAYTGGSTASRVDLTEEQFAVMDIDQVVIDPSSSDKLKDNSSQLVMKNIYGKNTDSDPNNNIRLYVTLPMVWDSANYDCILAGSYYLAYLLYNSLTLEKVTEKVNAVFELFYGDDGENVLEDMQSFFVGKSASNNTILSLFKEVKIAYTGTTYTLIDA